MQSTIIVTRNHVKMKAYVQKICTDFHIDPFDITEISQDTIGIDIVKEIIKSLLYKPLKGDAKALVVFNAQTMTTEAQNAFLKALEEPPAQTYIFLMVSDTQALLPTILSRCSIVTIPEKPVTLSEDEYAHYQLQFQSILSGTIGIKLLLAQEEGKTKEKALAWLEKAIAFLREMLRGGDYSVIPLIDMCIESYRIIKTTNVNPRFVLEQLFLKQVTHVY